MAAWFLKARPGSAGGFLAVLLLVAFVSGCSSASKKVPELAKMEGKKVALVELEGEKTSKLIVETALVNQLIKHGSFILISKPELEKARAAPDLDPLDWKGLARRAGADFAMKASVLEFEAVEHQGYEKKVVEDSLLKAETGQEKAEVYQKLKALDGSVKVRIEFADLQTGELRSADAVQTERVEGKLPLKMSFLDRLANEAFRKFFEQYR